MNAPKSEEFVRGACWALIPLTFAWYTRNHIAYGMPSETPESIQTVFSALYDEKFFDQHQTEFFAAVKVLFSANRCLLLREYAVVVLCSILLGLGARYFGSIKDIFAKAPLLSKCFHGLILPTISEWHIALSPMLLKRKRSYIEIDVMTKTGVLYRGVINEKHIGADGSLQTLVLSNPARFLQADFIRDRTEYEALADKSFVKKPQTSTYWKTIPGDVFMIVGSDVTSVNVRYVAKLMDAVEPKRDADLLKVMKELSNAVDKLNRANSRS